MELGASGNWRFPISDFRLEKERLLVHDREADTGFFP
jgi:hypothetical protein